MPASEDLLKAIAVTCELTRTELSGAAARVLAADLARYPEGQVFGALERCRRELRGSLTVADVVSRLDDGRPGPEEAWAAIPRDEAASVVWTDEMREAYAACSALIREGDIIAARMAFLERYRKALVDARFIGRPTRWEPCLGHDQAGREAAIAEGVKSGKLSAEHLLTLPPGRFDGIMQDHAKRLK